MSESGGLGSSGSEVQTGVVLAVQQSEGGMGVWSGALHGPP